MDVLPMCHKAAYGPWTAGMFNQIRNNVGDTICCVNGVIVSYLYIIEMCSLFKTKDR